MSRRGYAGTTVAEIVNAAGVGAPTLYWHFKNKRGILEAVMIRGGERWKSALPEWSAISHGTQRERYIKTMNVAAKALIEQPHFLRLLTLLALELGEHDESLFHDMRRGRENARTWMIGIMQSAWPSLPMASANEFAFRIMAIADGACVQQLLEYERAPARIHAWIHQTVADEAESIVAKQRRKPDAKRES